MPRRARGVIPLLVPRPSMRPGYLIVPAALRDEGVRRKRARWGPGPL